MENNFDKIPIRDINERLDFSEFGLGRWGFIIPFTKNYKDSVFYMPQIEGDARNGIHHATILKYMLIKLFKNERNDFFQDYKKIAFKEEEMPYMDSEETAIASFIASLNSIVFTNTSQDQFHSGLLFVPEKTEILQEDKSFLEILDFLYEGKDLTSQIVIVPSLDDAFNNNKKIQVFDLEEYQEFCNNKASKHR